MLAIGMGLMGITYGPLGTIIGELFPTEVRYTGTSLAFNSAAILGASMAPYIATALARKYGLWSVGCYLAGSAVVTLIGVALMKPVATFRHEPSPAVPEL
jgi:MFS family permease